MSTIQRPRRKVMKRVRRPHSAAGSPIGGAIAPLKATARTPRAVLIATDGSRPASAALKLARLMVLKGAWTPDVLTVLQPLPIAVGDMMLPAPAIHYQMAISDSVGEEIRQQLKRYGDISWNLTMEFGRAVPLIVRTARERKAALIVLGLGRHGRLGRLFGAETAARVTRHTDIPVLAVHDRTRALPNVALAAVDFSDSSLRAAREALALLDPPGRLHLVHVKWNYNMTSFADSEWERAYSAGADEEFSRLRAKLGSRPGIEITTALLTGDVIENVLSEAKAIHANVIALGSHSRNVLDRLIIGSTPAQLLRAAPCSVLVTPPVDAQT